MFPTGKMHLKHKKSKLNFGQTSKSNHIKTTKRFFHYKPLNKRNSGAFLGEIKNDRKHNEALSTYKKRSIGEFNQILKPNQFYIYTDRSSLKRGLLKPGHIVSFITSSNANILDGSCVSLRHHKIKKKDVALEFELSHDNSMRRYRTNPIWDVRFLDIQEELDEFLFKNAKEGFSLDKDTSRFLTGIPLSILPEPADKIIERIKEVKQSLANSEYILADGKRILLPNNKVDKFVKAVNCVTGVYRGLGVKGIESSPSTQMATTGLLKLLLGEEEKDELIRDTGLRRLDDEKRYGQDDELSWTGPTKGFRI